jgi:caffeoyl-CoA O-methyltransferase
VLAKFTPMTPELYRYVVEHCTPRDAALDQIERQTQELPYAVMQMAPEQGALFTVLVGALRTRLAVEIGTFTGYGAVCIARGLPPGGRLICCELDPERAATASRNLELAGVSDRAVVRVGPALETLRALPPEPIDFAFVDADKTGYRDYYEELLPRMSDHGLLVFDNVLMDGDVLDPEPSGSVRAIQELNDALAHDPRVEVAMVGFADGVTFVRRRGPSRASS